MPNPRVVLVEDDHLQSEYIRDLIESASLEVEPVSTESDFRQGLFGGTWDPPESPTAFVIDVMLRWSNPRHNMPVPPIDVIDGGSFRAGLRCARLIREHFRQPGEVPHIAILTVLNREDLDLERPFQYFSKRDGELYRLRQWLESLKTIL
jgi:hypothetical protein